MSKYNLEKYKYQLVSYSQIIDNINCDNISYCTDRGRYKLLFIHYYKKYLSCYSNKKIISNDEKNSEYKYMMDYIKEKININDDDYNYAKAIDSMNIMKYDVRELIFNDDTCFNFRSIKNISDRNIILPFECLNFINNNLQEDEFIIFHFSKFQSNKSGYISEMVAYMEEIEDNNYEYPFENCIINNYMFTNKNRGFLIENKYKNNKNEIYIMKRDYEHADSLINYNMIKIMNVLLVGDKIIYRSLYDNFDDYELFSQAFWIDSWYKNKIKKAIRSYIDETCY
jgi:hypothetical protein